MKKIPLKVIPENVRGREKPVDLVWSDVLLASVRDGGSQGVTIADMRNRIAIIDRLERAVKDEAEYVLLETEQQKTLAEILKTRRFTRVSKALIELMDAVENAPDVEVTEASE